MYEIRKQFECCSSHQLSGLPDGHGCARLHGHNYSFELILQSETLNEVGFVRDYGELKSFKEFIDQKLDHRHLNDIVPFNPTAENLAEWLFGIAKQMAPEVVEVRVSETPKTWASYSEK